MRIYHASAGLIPRPDYERLMRGESGHVLPQSVMWSFADSRKNWDETGYESVVLDSGAFSVWKSGAKLTVEDHWNYVLDNQHRFDWCIAFDEVPDPERGAVSMRNFDDERAMGCDVVPVWHTGDAPDILDVYCRESERVCLAVSGDDVMGARAEFAWAMRRHPETKWHGLKCLRLIPYLPFDSVDGSTAFQMARHKKFPGGGESRALSTWELLVLWVREINARPKCTEMPKEAEWQASFC